MDPANAMSVLAVLEMVKGLEDAKDQATLQAKTQRRSWMMEPMEN